MPKIIVGLGNPGVEYVHTRHNYGFLVMDRLAHSRGVNFVHKNKFTALVSEFSAGGEKVVLLKPQTLYNESGQAVRAAMDFYKLMSTDVLVVHDDLALPFGTIRIRIGGSDAGNNGIKSISTQIGENYTRLRLGTWSTQRDQVNDTTFVLGRFTQDEMSALNETLLAAACERIEQFITGQLQAHTHTALEK